MAIISGYTPAERRPIAQPWQLPFNEMYTALKEKQTIADAQAAKGDELMATLASMQDFLPKDLELHRDRMTNIMQQEQSLREQVGEDLSRPEYRQGLRKLILTTASDPFYTIAAQNYKTVSEGEKLKQQLMVEGKWEGEHQLTTDYDPATYTGAIDEAGSMNKLPTVGVAPSDEFYQEVYKIASDIIPEEWKDAVQDEKTGIWYSKEGKKLDVPNIVQTLWDNQPGWGTGKQYARYYKKLKHQNPDMTEADLQKHLNDMFTGIAEVFDRKYRGESIIAFPDDGAGTGKKSLNIKPFISVKATHSVDSSGYATPKDAKEWEQYNKNLIAEGGLIDNDKKALENKLGVSIEYNMTINKPQAVKGDILSSFTNDDRVELDIKDADGNIITEDSPLYQDNYEEFTTLKYKYEQAIGAIDRVQEFDAFALAESGFDRSKVKYTQEDIDKKALEIYAKRKGDNSILDILIASMGSKDPTPSGAVYTPSEILKNLDQADRDAAYRDAERELMDKDPQRDNFKRYKEIYEQSYSNGTYPVTQYGNSFGYDDEAKKFKAELTNTLLNYMSQSLNDEDFRGLTAYNTVNGTGELKGKDYNDFAQRILKKAEAGEIELNNVQWRLDDGGDGLVVDLTVEGKLIEIRDVQGISEYLSSRGYQDISFLNLLDQASRSLKPSDGRTDSNISDIGQANDYGFIGGHEPGWPKDKFKRTSVPYRYLGKNYPAGSFYYRGKLYNNMYEVGVAYLQHYSMLQQAE